MNRHLAQSEEKLKSSGGENERAPERGKIKLPIKTWNLFPSWVFELSEEENSATFREGRSPIAPRILRTRKNSGKTPSSRAGKVLKSD